MSFYLQGQARSDSHAGQVPLGVGPDNRYRPIAVDGEGRLVAAEQPATPQTLADTDAPAANTKAEVTYAAPGLGYAHSISGLVWSATGTITAADLTIKSGNTTVFTVGVGAAGAGSVFFPGGLRVATDAALTVTLPALGESAKGRVNVIGHRVLLVDPAAAWGVLSFLQPPQSQYLPLL